MKHAKLSASGSARWLYCAGSVQAEQGIKDRSSPAAAEGTCAHELSSMVLLDDTLNPSDYIDQTLNDAPDVPVDSEMVDYVINYADYCRSLMTETAQMFVEQRVDFSDWVPDGFGTSDCIIIDGSTCHIIDLKYGKGIPVYAENNSQALLYAMGVMSDYGFIYDIERYVMHIYQPRINNTSVWEISEQDLLEWAEWAKGRAAACLKPDAVRTPGESQCTWCKAKATCPALKAHTEEVITSSFDNLDLPDPRRADISNVLANKKLIESYLKAVEDYAKEQLLDGQQVEGFKLVAGRANRRWADEAVAKDIMVTELGNKALTEPKLISVAQAEKALGKKFKELEADLVVKPEGSPTIAPADDKRQSIIDVSNLFD